VQEDELVAAEWQTLAQFEENPFPKDIPLLGQVWEPKLRRASVSVLFVVLMRRPMVRSEPDQPLHPCADCRAVLSVRSRGVPWLEDPQIPCAEQAQRGHTDVRFK
jgi:hypothetical protein